MTTSRLHALHMRSEAARLVGWGQIGLWSLLAVCIALHPGLVLKRDEGGLSNYGVHLKTVIPYSLALLSATACTYGAARRLRVDARDAVVMRAVLHVYALLVALSLMSTYLYRSSNLLDDLHVGVNVATALFETIGALWIVSRPSRDAVMFAMLGLELTGFVLGVLTIANVAHLVFVAEVLIGVGFGVMLVRMLDA